MTAPKPESPQPNPPPAAKQPAAAFFVGYLPMPAALKRFYWPLAVLLIVACGGLGYGIAANQKTTGPAHWHTAEAVTMQGVLTLTPYPVLHRFNPAVPGQIESVLLVQPGKHSAQPLATKWADEFAADYDQQAVAVHGYEIKRGNWRMLEITGIQAAHSTDKVAHDAITRLLTVKELGEITVTGEIADSKCFLGVMKPGTGMTHKACAEVCMLGGIPPMVVATDADRQKFAYLLTRADGSSASTQLARFAADKVRIRGQLRQQGDLLFIAMDENGIQRR